MHNDFTYNGKFGHRYTKREEDYDLEIKAIDKIKDKIKEAQDEYIQRKIECTPPAFVGGYDIDTKYIYADYAKEPPIYIQEQLKQLIEDKVTDNKINDIGQKGKETKNTVGRCAEFHVVNGILIYNEKAYHNKNNIDNIRLTFAVRLKNEEKFGKKFKKMRIKKESTGLDVYKHWINVSKEVKWKYLPYCPNCKAMFEGTYILKKQFIN